MHRLYHKQTNTRNSVRRTQTRTTKRSVSSLSRQCYSCTQTEKNKTHTSRYSTSKPDNPRIYGYKETTKILKTLKIKYSKKTQQNDEAAKSGQIIANAKTTIRCIRMTAILISQYLRSEVQTRYTRKRLKASLKQNKTKFSGSFVRKLLIRTERSPKKAGQTKRNSEQTYNNKYKQQKGDGLGKNSTTNTAQNHRKKNARIAKKLTEPLTEQRAVRPSLRTHENFEAATHHKT